MHIIAQMSYGWAISYETEHRKRSRNYRRKYFAAAAMREFTSSLA